jgi:hypothetical protein
MVRDKLRRTRRRELRSGVAAAAAGKDRNERYRADRQTKILHRSQTLHSLFT